MKQYRDGNPSGPLQYIQKESSAYDKRLLTNSYEKRPMHMKRDQSIWKETNAYEMRPLQENTGPMGVYLVPYPSFFFWGGFPDL